MGVTGVVGLGIDTAGPVIGAALWSLDDAVLLGSWSVRAVRGADAELVPAVAHLLEGLDAPLDRVAVAVGPGAFTGLRVGVACALGIALACGVGVVAVSSLQARAALVGAPCVLALLDARKGRVYAGLFDGMAPVPLALGPEVDVDPLVAMPDRAFVAVGEGAVVHASVVLQAGGTLADGADRSAAGEVARLGFTCEPMDPALINLRYLRAADARRPGHSPAG